MLDVQQHWNTRIDWKLVAIFWVMVNLLAEVAVDHLLLVVHVVALHHQMMSGHERRAANAAGEAD